MGVQRSIKRLLMRRVEICFDPRLRVTRHLRRSVVMAFALIASLTSCATTTRTNLVEHSGASECVVLLHGLNRSWRAMNKMADALQRDGFSTANVDYPSQQGTVEGLAPLAVSSGVDQCRLSGASRIHFVTHSLGGILLRYAHGIEPIPELGRVVMLGPPNQGSEVIDRTRNWSLTRMFSGEAGMQLGTAPEDIPAKLLPVDFELGIVAGTATISPFMSAMLPKQDDGKVTVERTKADGMSDFLVVPVSHFAIMRNKRVIENTKAFLNSGQFLESVASD